MLSGCRFPEIVDSYGDAIEFILTDSGGKKKQKTAWNDYVSAAHNELAAFNENGEDVIEGSLTQIVMVGDDYSDTVVQNYLALDNELLK